ncbi:hypothetical protein ElyMa_002837300 [Elysia marginata]|uniref:Uncharacterized protein n=1 Tax=Elysia marginata TaxID=1093978 RepID=A0AAV4HVB9_9GAST|nr:hypothetical protein ElyMa_002837300 [Elysia marginata]
MEASPCQISPIMVFLTHSIPRHHPSQHGSVWPSVCPEEGSQIFVQRVRAEARWVGAPDPLPLQAGERQAQKPVRQQQQQRGCHNEQYFDATVEFMRCGNVQENEAHSGGNPRWLTGLLGPSANHLL